MPQPNSANNKAWWQPAMEIFAQVSGWIVFPLLLAIYLGKWLQGKWGHEPWIYIGCVASAFVITNVGLIRATLKAAKKMQKIIDEDKEKPKK
jgi:hypothetical protein